MKEFDSFAGIAEEFVEQSVAHVELHEIILEKSALMIEKRAKNKIAHLQPDAEPFAAWEPLAESTIERKESVSTFALNSEGNPLLVTGEMRDSIEHLVMPGEAHIGSNSDIAVYQELGTDKIPPRSFLGGAAAESGHKIADMAGAETMLLFQGKDIKSLASGVMHEVEE